MSTNTKEIGFEAFIEGFLLSQSNYQKRSSSDYNKDYCMDTEILLSFLQSTQSKQWSKLAEHYGDRVEDRFLARLSDEIKARGLLDVLRNGMKDSGVSFSFVYFQPNTDFNPESIELYHKNVFSVMRQVKYSKKNENSIDMVLFLNGLPIITIELKNQLTGQSIEHGIRQYQMDRDPRETLLSFQRCLVHFAVDTEQAYMTTELKGTKTYFLPFNRGDNGSAGNPTVQGKYKTAYMWEDVWMPDTILDLISRFICLQKEEKVSDTGKKEKVERLIFPRYHQLDAVRSIIANVRYNGAGKNYLIQHSAGSGKSNTIAWVAHRLADLHDAKSEKIFDSVIIITDRRVLDKQLRETVAQFEQVRGVVKPITEGSAELKTALENGEKIIITTLQKFPFIADEMGQIPGRTFAVIIDEAHSSQSGESSKAVNEVLSVNEADEDTALEQAFQIDSHIPAEDGEDWLAKQMTSRSRKNSNVSYFAFTATPKPKTVEIFGEKGFDGKYHPFSVYTMKQAIEEGFIEDVLKNYTTYKMYFSLHKSVENDPQYSKKQATRVLIGAVDKSEHAIGKKVDIIVKHFDEHIRNNVDGKSKAMIVSKSRLHAVRYKLAIDKYFKENGYPFKALVAFSGKVIEEKDTIEYTEANMNGIPESQTKDQFKKDDYKFLIVAEKYQTGFDQPLLAAMYVDKKLGGVNAVQTLSRLNRTHPDKDEVFVLDFVNDTEDIKEAFQPYYTTTVLSEGTEPNILYNLQRDILSFKLFDEREITEFVEMWHRNVSPAELNAFLDAMLDRWYDIGDDNEESEEQIDFRDKITDYIKKYAFISQIITFTDTSLEAMYIFLRFYKKKLPLTRNPLPLELLELVNLETLKIPKTGETSIKLENKVGEMTPMSGSGRGKDEDDTEILSKILNEVNDRFGTTFSEEDRVLLNNLSKRLMDNEALVGAIHNNSSEDAIRVKFDEIFTKELISMFNSNFTTYQKIDKNADLKDYVSKKMFDFIQTQVKKGK